MRKGVYFQDFEDHGKGQLISEPSVKLMKAGERPSKDLIEFDTERYCEEAWRLSLEPRGAVLVARSVSGESVTSIPLLITA